MSISLPIIKSFLSVDALSKTLERVYRLKGVRCRLLQATLRDVYYVESSTGVYVACIYPPSLDKRTGIEHETTFLRYLKSNGLPVVTPVPDAIGEYIQDLDMPEGERYVVLFEYIAGQAMNRQPDKTIIQRYGALIARLHQIADAYPYPIVRPNYDSHYLLTNSFNAIADVLFHRLDVLKELRQALNTLKPPLDKLSKDSASYGLIHGDVIPSNLQMSETGELTLLDFDLLGYGWRTYDIATFINEVLYWQMGDEAEQAFLTGYEVVRSLSAEEKAALPLLGAARAIFSMGVAAAHVNMWGSHLYFSDAIVERLMTVLRSNLQRLNLV